MDRRRIRGRSALFVARGVALGAYLATGLSCYGAVDVSRVDAGPLDVPEVHAAGKRHVFLARNPPRRIRTFVNPGREQ